MFRDILHNSLLRFLLVGGISTFINFTVFTILYTSKIMHYDAAFIFGFLSGVVVGYFFNRRWSFQVRSENHIRHARRYLTTYSISLLTGVACVRWAVEDLGINPFVANVFVICITTSINYIGIRFWAFSR
jgi:putative flippase GtrA